MLGNEALTRRHGVWHINQCWDQMAAGTVLILRPPVCTLVQDSHRVGCVYRLLLVMLCLRHRDWHDGVAPQSRRLRQSWPIVLFRRSRPNMLIVLATVALVMAALNASLRVGAWCARRIGACWTPRHAN